jgi:hypothetical protein
MLIKLEYSVSKIERLQKVLKTANGAIKIKNRCQGLIGNVLRIYRDCEADEERQIETQDRNAV